MDDLDRQILILFQKEIPLKPRPFEVLAKTAGIDSGELLLRLNRLQKENILGRIRGVFDAERLGYRSALLAMQVHPEMIERAAYYLSGHPGVTYCVRRKGNLNFWFVLSLPVWESFEFHTQRLQNLCAASRVLTMQTLKMYKPRGGKPQSAAAAGVSAEELTALEKDLIRVIQEDLPIADHPFAKIAKELGSSEELVLKQLSFLQNRGFMKKVAAEPAARDENGCNALVFWDVPEEKQDALGDLLSGWNSVLFCAKREPLTELPFSFHAVIEGKSPEEILAAVQKAEAVFGAWPCQCYFKEKEVKRSAVKFFSKEIEEWRFQQDVFESTPLESV